MISYILLLLSNFLCCFFHVYHLLLKLKCNKVRENKYLTVGTFTKPNRKTKNTTLSEHLQNLIEKQKNTTLSEHLQNLIEKQKIPHCRNIYKA
jgi:hypothetical protein